MATIWGTDNGDTIAPYYVSPGVTGGRPGDGFDVMAGYAGSDVLVGGGASDYLFAGEFMFDDHYSDVNVTNYLYGEGGNDALFGAGGDDYLRGGDGDDSFFGLSGDDEIYGDAGTDTVSYAYARSGVIIDLKFGSGTAHGGDGDDRLYSIERAEGSRYDDTMTGSSHVADVLRGGAGDDRLYGLGGNDRLDGGPGSDILSGESGRDTYVVDDRGDRVWESGDDYDTVEASISYILPSAVEQLVLTGAGAIDGTGNGLRNVMFGNDAANVLRGRAGNDILFGEASDGPRSGAGRDRLEGEEGDDWLMGYGGDDKLYGGDGGDSLLGGQGADMLSGGRGRDAFIWYATSESTATARDTILDFERGADLIALSPIDANVSLAGNQTFRFGGVYRDFAEGFRSTGEIKIIDDGSSTRIVANTDQNRWTAELEIRVANIGDAYAWSAANFEL